MWPNFIRLGKKRKISCKISTRWSQSDYLIIQWKNCGEKFYTVFFSQILSRQLPIVTFQNVKISVYHFFLNRGLVTAGFENLSNWLKSCSMTSNRFAVRRFGLCLKIFFQFIYFRILSAEMSVLCINDTYPEWFT